MVDISGRCNFPFNSFALSLTSYKGIGKSFVDKEGTPDANEFYNLSKDDMLNQLQPVLSHPQIIQAERRLIRAFILHSHAIVITLLRHISASLGLYPTMPDHSSSADVLPSLHHLTASSEDQISLIKYPGCDVLQTKQPLASHTDYGSLTLLFTSSPGLQVLVPGRDPEHSQWLDVEPRDGHAIVNCGDALALFTNKLLRSNVHRVASQVQRGSSVTRYSLGYFARPGNDVLLRPLPGVMVPAESQPSGDGVTSKEWVLRRSYGRLMECYEGQHTWGKTVGTEVTEV
jgi:isopenicillin N synthase-like dioxygenase